MRSNFQFFVMIKLLFAASILTTKWTLFQSSSHHNIVDVVVVAEAKSSFSSNAPTALPLWGVFSPTSAPTSHDKHKKKKKHKKKRKQQQHGDGDDDDNEDDDDVSAGPILQQQTNNNDNEQQSLKKKMKKKTKKKIQTSSSLLNSSKKQKLQNAQQIKSDKPKKKKKKKKMKTKTPDKNFSGVSSLKTKGMVQQVASPPIATRSADVDQLLLNQPKKKKKKKKIVNKSVPQAFKPQSLVKQDPIESKVSLTANANGGSIKKKKKKIKKKKSSTVVPKLNQAIENETNNNPQEATLSPKKKKKKKKTKQVKNKHSPTTWSDNAVKSEMKERNEEATLATATTVKVGDDELSPVMKRVKKLKKKKNIKTKSKSLPLQGSMLPPPEKSETLANNDNDAGISEQIEEQVVDPSIVDQDVKQKKPEMQTLPKKKKRKMKRKYKSTGENVNPIDTKDHEIKVTPDEQPNLEAAVINEPTIIETPDALEVEKTLPSITEETIDNDKDGEEKTNYNDDEPILESRNIEIIEVEVDIGATGDMSMPEIESVDMKGKKKDSIIEMGKVEPLANDENNDKETTLPINLENIDQLDEGASIIGSTPEEDKVAANVLQPIDDGLSDKVQSDLPPSENINNGYEESECEEPSLQFEKPVELEGVIEPEEEDVMDKLSSNNVQDIVEDAAETEAVNVEGVDSIRHDEINEINQDIEDEVEPALINDTVTEAEELGSSQNDSKGGIAAVSLDSTLDEGTVDDEAADADEEESLVEINDSSTEVKLDETQKDEPEIKVVDDDDDDHTNVQAQTGSISTDDADGTNVENANETNDIEPHVISERATQYDANHLISNENADKDKDEDENEEDVDIGNNNSDFVQNVEEATSTSHPDAIVDDLTEVRQDDRGNDVTKEEEDDDNNNNKDDGETLLPGMTASPDASINDQKENDSTDTANSDGDLAPSNVSQEETNKIPQADEENVTQEGKESTSENMAATEENQDEHNVTSDDDDEEDEDGDDDNNDDTSPSRETTVPIEPNEAESSEDVELLTFIGRIIDENVTSWVMDSPYDDDNDGDGGKGYVPPPSPLTTNDNDSNLHNMRGEYSEDVSRSPVNAPTYNAQPTSTAVIDDDMAIITDDKGLSDVLGNSTSSATINSTITNDNAVTNTTITNSRNISNTTIRSDLSTQMGDTTIQKVQFDRMSLETMNDSKNDITVSVVTWNLAEESPSEDDATFIRKFRQSKQNNKKFPSSDLVLISGQECENIKPRRTEGHRSREFRRLMVKMLGKQYVPIALHMLGGIQLGLFAKRSILHDIEFVGVADVTCGIGNVFHNKGAIGAFVKMKSREPEKDDDKSSKSSSSSSRDRSVRLLFVTAHLAAHVKNSHARDADFWRIASELEAQASPMYLPQRLKDSASSSSSSPGDETSGSLLFDVSDRIFFCGDLNYRVDLPREEAEHSLQEMKRLHGTLSDSKPIKKKDQIRATLLRHDQLLQSIAERRAFTGFAEGKISFSPTFKFDKGTGDYDTSHKQRIPAWTDRILYKPFGTRVLEYNSVETAQHSDHRPVYGTYRVSLLGRELQSKKKRRKNSNNSNFKEL